MLKLYITLFSFLAVTGSFAQTADSNSGSLIKKASGLFGKSSGGTSGLSSDDIIAGLKEALVVGAKNSTDKFLRMLPLKC